MTTKANTVVIETAKLEGYALDWATMRAAGYILVRVGYEGGEYESPEQATLPKWFKFQTDNAVGAYWMKEKGEKWEYAYWPPYTGIYQDPASPSTDSAHLAWDLVVMGVLGVSFVVGMLWVLVDLVRGKFGRKS
ncbi:hypothetical protein [Pseudomonas sp. UMAB-40]|uniref:hypothetical protein n=1 Tax=Pseudomonas sp. UMAB-40 TaxID=1365407 RepID=UPI001C562EBF|nr:hypothetical protein [Pseudomonas sp. UMAB-40]